MKIDSKRIVVLNVKGKTIKLLQDIIGENEYDLEKRALTTKLGFFTH